MAGDLGQYFVSTPYYKVLPRGNVDLIINTKPHQHSMRTCKLTITFRGRQPYVRNNPPAKVSIYLPFLAPGGGPGPSVKSLVETGVPR